MGRSTTVTPAMTAETQRKIADLVAQLKQRDSDPAYAAAPVVDTYARISRVYDGWDRAKTDDQTIEVLRWMLNAHVPLRLGELLADNNVSAWKISARRPGFGRALERMEQSQSAGVVAYNTDRITRQLGEAVALVELGKTRGVKIWSVTAGDLDLTTVNGQARLYDQTKTAWEESARKSERLTRGYARQREARLFQVRNQFGYPFDTTHPEGSTQLTAERDAICWGINHVISGGVAGKAGSWKQIADEWNRRGLRTRVSVDRDGTVKRGGEPFKLGKVRNILTNPRHAGYLTLNKGEDGRNDHRGARTIVGVAAEVSIVDTDTWARFEAVLAGRSGKRKSISPNHLLSGMVFCAECGGSLVGSTYSTTYDDGELRRGYRCSPVTGCGKVGIDARILETIVHERTIEAWCSPDNVTRIARRNQRLSTLDAEIDYWTGRQAEIFDAWNAVGPGGRRRMTTGQYTSATDACMVELDRLATERKAVEDDSTGVPEVKVQAEAEQEWAAHGRDGKRGMVQAAWGRGVLVAKPERYHVRGTLENCRGRVQHWRRTRAQRVAA
jgi:DNA invertase Pin-like site-specific DNA recombinase